MGKPADTCTVFRKRRPAPSRFRKSWSQPVQSDVVQLLRKPIPKDVSERGHQDSDGDFRLKSGLAGLRKPESVIRLT